MTKNEWMQKVRLNKDKLITFISDWHPSSTGKVKCHELKITAPNAERACEQVRDRIQQQETNPVKKFEEAIELNDIYRINTILNSAWFGVPESTGCWNQIGFKEAVELMDDLPEGDDEMIESRKKNQEATRKIIHDFALQNHANPEVLKEFMKYFAKNIMPRIEQDDCFFVDLLEDIERIK